MEEIVWAKRKEEPEKPRFRNGENLLPGSNSLSSICECGKFRANSWQPRWAEFLTSALSHFNMLGATMEQLKLGQDIQDMVPNAKSQI